MTQDKQVKQKKLTQDYTDFLIEHEVAKTQGKALGTFLEWQHKNDRVAVSKVKRDGT
jgi:hypothetical protein